MQFKNVIAGVAAAVSLIAPAAAIIEGVAVPQTIVAGQPFNIILETANYIQSVQDVAVAFGIQSTPGYPGELGQILGEFFIGPSQSNILTNITNSVTVPSNSQGQVLISAYVYSLFGALYGPTLSSWNVTTTVGDSISSTYISSSRHD